MLLATSVSEIPGGLAFAPWSAEEFNSATEAARNSFVRQSKLWTVERDGEIVLVAGVIKASLISDPELWVLLCESFHKKLIANVREGRTLMAALFALYPRVSIRVNANCPSGERFARLMGFDEVLI